MPALGKHVGELIGIQEFPSGASLAVNRETGAWAVLNQAAIGLLERQHSQSGSAATCDDPRVAARLEKLRSPEGPTPDERLRTGNSLYVIYKLTDACNFSCSYCYDEPFRRRRNVEKRDEVFRSVAEDFLHDESHKLYVLFHGGEPLLDFRAIRRVVEEYELRFPGRIFFSIQTNGSLLTEEVIRFFTDHRVGIAVSVDGVTQQDNALRINTAKIDPYSQILRLTSENGLLPRTNLGLHLTVTPYNYKSLDRIILQMEQDGFRSISFSFYQAVKRSPLDLLEWNADAVVAKLIELVELVNRHEILKCSLHYLVQMTLRVLHIRHELVCLSSPCGAGREVIAIYPSGELGPCDSIFEPKLLSESLAQYEEARSRSPLFQRLMSRSVDTIEPCRRCDLKRFCNGTCPGNANLSTSDVNGVDAFECRFNFALIRALMWVVSDPHYRNYVDYCMKKTQARSKLQHELASPLPGARALEPRYEAASA